MTEEHWHDRFFGPVPPAPPPPAWVAVMAGPPPARLGIDQTQRSPSGTNEDTVCVPANAAEQDEDHLSADFAENMPVNLEQPDVIQDPNDGFDMLRGGWTDREPLGGMVEVEGSIADRPFPPEDDQTNEDGTDERRQWDPGGKNTWSDPGAITTDSHKAELDAYLTLLRTPTLEVTGSSQPKSLTRPSQKVKSAV